MQPLEVGDEPRPGRLPSELLARLRIGRWHVEPGKASEPAEEGRWGGRLLLLILLEAMPGAIAIMALSWVYVLLGHLAFVAGLFFGLGG